MTCPSSLPRFLVRPGETVTVRRRETLPADPRRLCGYLVTSTAAGGWPRASSPVHAAIAETTAAAEISGYVREDLDAQQRATDPLWPPPEDEQVALHEILTPALAFPPERLAVAYRSVAEGKLEIEVLTAAGARKVWCRIPVSRDLLRYGAELAVLEVLEQDITRAVRAVAEQPA